MFIIENFARSFVWDYQTAILPATLYSDETVV